MVKPKINLHINMEVVSLVCGSHFWQVGDGFTVGFTRLPNISGLCVEHSCKNLVVTRDGNSHPAGHAPDSLILSQAKQTQSLSADKDDWGSKWCAPIKRSDVAKNLLKRLLLKSMDVDVKTIAHMDLYYLYYVDYYWSQDPQYMDVDCY